MSKFKLGDKVKLIANVEEGRVVSLIPEREVITTDFDNNLFSLGMVGPAVIISWDKREWNETKCYPISVEFFEHA